MSNLIEAYMNNIQTNVGNVHTTTTNIVNKTDSYKPTIIKTEISNDSFEKTSDKKKKIIKYSVIGLGIILLILTLINRKRIGKFFSDLFNNNPKDNIPPNESSLLLKRNGEPPVPPSASGQCQMLVKPKLSPLEQLEQLVEKWEALSDDDPMKEKLYMQICQLKKHIKMHK